MAYIIPSDLSRMALSGDANSEMQTLRFLKKALPNDYTVFHSVHWTVEYKGWTHFGEIDFVILNRSGDLLFIEQKDGPLIETDEGLEKQYQDGSKNPVDQLHRSIDKVREKFKWQHGKNRSLAIDYIVYLPDHHVRNVNGAGIGASRIVDAADKGQLARRIEKILGPGVPGNDGWYEKLHEFFCQTFQVVPDIHAHNNAQQKGFVRQAGPVASVLAGLEMTPFRLRFSGTAGSGKSLIARNFVARAAAEGKRVLLTCFNRPLAARLSNSVPEGVKVDTFHGFCVEFLRSRGYKPDFGKQEGESAFWRQIPDLVMSEQIPEEGMFDVLVIDEGQDFEQDWLEILKLFLKDDADILWLEDPAQNILDKKPVETKGFVGYRCNTNYRSPDLIARFIRDRLPFEFEAGNTLSGLGVGVREYEEPGEQPAIVARVVQDLIRRGFSYDDIVIVSCQGVKRSAFSEVDAIGGVKLRRVTGEYDAEGNQLLTDGQLTFESIYRFKGQESPAVILVDVDPRQEHGEREERLLYCGMTRATIRLDLIVRKDNPSSHRLLKSA